MNNCANISLKDVLMELCHETLWKYAIYWRLDCGPHQVLAWEDGYVDSRKLQNGLIDFEDGNSVYFCSIEQILADMSHHLFSVGEGIIGEVALTGQHKWIFPEMYELDMLYKLPEDWQRQFLSGIKTILLVPIDNFGVLQLGSFHMVCENHNLVAKINELFAGLYQTLDSAVAKYTSSHDFLEEISSECLPINPYNLPFFTHPLDLDFSLVDNIHLQTLDHNVTSFVWDGSLVDTSVEQNHFADESFIVSNLPFTPEHEPHGVKLGCLDENIAPKGDILQSSLDKISTGLTKETGTEHLIEEIIISSNDSSVVKKSFNPVTDSPSVLYWPESRIEGVQTSTTPLPLSNYFNDCLPVNRNNKMCNSGMTNKIQKRKVMNKDMEKRRPRDRELIQNRIKELRELIPEGSKCSIDSLLEKTVKHMLFLENVSKLAEKLKQTESSQVRRAERYENKHSNELSVDMWASKKENKTNMVPLIVEDVDHPAGNILIEMLCSEYDIFLEMANIMEGLQLRILKGVLDNRSGELWAHFVIEVGRGFDRTHIVWPLIQLLQRPSSN